jgi:site-specific DNA-methyltransferase (adenine-specific)
MVSPLFKSIDKNFYLIEGDCIQLLGSFNFKFDLIFADPPYFLSNNGLTIKNGKITSVNRGKWDKSQGSDFVNDFNRQWLKLVRDKMRDDATIWISGTMHNIFSIGQILGELDFKILNVVTWQKTNPHLIFRAGSLPTQPSKLFGHANRKKFRITITML